MKPPENNWLKTTLVNPEKVKLETQQEAPKSLTPEKEKILNLAHDIAEKKREESKILNESWTNQEEILEESKEQKQKIRKDSPESTSSEPKYTGNRRNRKT